MANYQSKKRTTKTTKPETTGTAVTTKAPLGTPPRAPSYRLTSADRDKLARLIADAAVQPQKDALDAHRAAAAAKLAVHYHVPGAAKQLEKIQKMLAASAFREHRASLPSSDKGVFFRVRDTVIADLLGSDAAADMYTSNDIALQFPEDHPCSKDCVVPPTDSGTARFAALPRVLQVEIAKLLVAAQRVEQARGNLYRELLGQMERVSSSARLCELWPEAAPVVQQYYADREHVHTPLADLIRSVAGSPVLLGFTPAHAQQ